MTIFGENNMTTKMRRLIFVSTVIFTSVVITLSRELHSGTTTERPDTASLSTFLLKSTNEVSKPTKYHTTISQSNPEEKDDLIGGLEPGEFYGGITLLVLVFFCVILCSCLCKDKNDDEVQTLGKLPDVTDTSQNNGAAETVLEMNPVVRESDETRSENSSQRDGVYGNNEEIDEAKA